MIKPFRGFIETIEFEPINGDAYAIAQELQLGISERCNVLDGYRIIDHVRYVLWFTEMQAPDWVVTFYREQAQHLVKSLCKLDETLAGDVVAQLEETLA